MNDNPNSREGELTIAFTPVQLFFVAAALVLVIVLRRRCRSTS